MPVDTEWLFASFPRGFFSRDADSSEVVVIEEDTDVADGASGDKFLSAGDVASVGSDEASIVRDGTAALSTFFSTGGSSSGATTVSAN